MGRTKTKDEAQNYIYAYYQGIKDGSETVGRWIELLYEFIVHGIEEKRFIFDPKKANKAINFIETQCRHSEGALAPNLFKLELWQKALISCMFGIVGEDGYRQFHEVFVVVGRKNGKTLLASAIMAYMLFADDEYGAKAYCVAPKVAQADIVYNNFWQTVTLNKELAAKAKHRKSDIYIAETNSSLQKIALSDRTSDGFNPHLSVQDELAAWSGDKGLKGYEVLKSGAGARRQPIMFSISTSGYVNDSIYDELMKRSTRFLLGESKETRLLPFLYTIDDISKWNDINELRKSNPNLGVSVSVDYLLEEIVIAEGSLSKKAEFLTKYCNIKQNSSLAWLPAVAVEKASGAPIDLEQFRNHYAVAGIDLSRTTDLSAAVLVIEKDGRLYVKAKFFLPAEKLEEASARDGLPYGIYVQRGFLKLSGDNFIDYHDVFDFLRNAVETYQIYPLVCGYDKYSAQYLIQELNNYGFVTDDVFQGYNLSGVLDEAEGIIKDGNIDIGDNDLLKIHLLNAALKYEAQTERKKLVKISATDHIDGAAALMDALTVRQKHWKEIGGQLVNRRN
ncbi:MAG: terminase large subunit [Ruminococcus sp.]|nr:terminase large subunit [Ruminococcus sp.]